MTTQGNTGSQGNVTVEKLSGNEVKVTFPANVTVNADQIPAEELLRALTDCLFTAPLLGGGSTCIIQIKN